MASRKSIANYAARALSASVSDVGRARIIRQLAAWLKQEQLVRQADYLVQDIAEALEASGHVRVILVSARPLSSESKKRIMERVAERYGASTDFEVVEEINESIIGGVLVQTPSGTIDMTIKNKLNGIKRGVAL